MKKHHRPCHGHECKSHIKQRRRCGWNMNLYRNVDDKLLGGVCAGLADHFDIAHWVMRLLFIAAFFFTGTLAIFAYLAGWILLAPGRDEYAKETVEYDERRGEYRPRTLFRYGDDVSTRLQSAQQRMNDCLQRVEAMESYVTSRQYQLNKEFSRLAD